MAEELFLQLLAWAETKPMATPKKFSLRTFSLKVNNRNLPLGDEQEKEEEKTPK
jgi:hypothetical protein